MPNHDQTRLSLKATQRQLQTDFAHLGKLLDSLDKTAAKLAWTQIAILESENLIDQAASLLDRK